MKRTGPFQSISNEEKLISQLIVFRQVKKLAHDEKIASIDKLTLYNFTLEMPMDNLVMNSVLEVRKLILQSCNAFAITALFAFFLKRNHQI